MGRQAKPDKKTRTAPSMEHTLHVNKKPLEKDSLMAFYAI